MLNMVIERFKNGDVKAVNRRFRDTGRMAPDGLAYVESWVETKFDRCFPFDGMRGRETPPNSGQPSGGIFVDHAPSRERAMPRSLVNSASNRGLPGSLRARNFSPAPAPGLA
jgi:hypothetical protein